MGAEPEENQVFSFCMIFGKMRLMIQFVKN